MIKVVLLLSLPLLILAKTVTFNQALTLAVENNKELKAKEYDIALAQEMVKEPDAYKKGSLDFIENISNTNNAGHVFGMKLSSREASFSDFGFDEFLGQMGGLPGNAQQLLATQPKKLNDPDARTNFETKVVYEVPLFTGYKLENAKTMAELQLLAHQAKLSHDKKKIGLEVIKAYNGAVAAKKFISMTKKATKIAKRFQDIAQGMYDDGLTRMIDVQQAKMAAYTINTKVKEAKTQFNLAIAYLQFLTDDKSIKNVRGFKNFKVDSKKLSIMQEDAIANRDDYQWMEYNVQTMKTKIAYDSSGEYPTIGAHIEYGTNDNTFNPSFKKDYHLIAVGLKHNLFDGDLKKIAKAKAKISYAKTLEYKSYMKDGIQLEVKKNLLEYKMQRKILKEKIKTKKMAENILSETEKIYKNNLQFRTNMMYLLMGLEKMLKAQADVITTRYNKSIVSAKLKLSTGSSLGN